MPLTHLLLALAVVLVWGTNFVVIKLGLGELPPFLFATLRFLFSAFPFVFFIRRPPVRWRTLLAFGVLLGAGQFGLLFWAMRASISPGLASLVVQSQVFFTIGLSVALAGERVRPMQWAALALAIAGIVLIAVRQDASASFAGLALVLSAAFCWALANLVAKSAGKVDMLQLHGVEQHLRRAALAGLEPRLRRAGPDRRHPARCQPAGLGGSGLAGGWQHLVRLRCVELAALAPPGRDRDAERPAGAGVRHGRLGLVAGGVAAGAGSSLPLRW